MRSYTIRITKQADFDIENLHFYIVEICKSPITAKRYIQGLFNQIKSLTHTAESYPISATKTISQYGYNARRINYKKMAIIYTVHGKTVLIHRVLPGALISGL
jgi:plasmid stabilization system protein ParE